MHLSAAGLRSQATLGMQWWCPSGVTAAAQRLGFADALPRGDEITGVSGITGQRNLVRDLADSGGRGMLNRTACPASWPWRCKESEFTI